MCRQISVTTNSSVSQSTRPSEWLHSMDDIFGNSSTYVLPGEGFAEGGRYDSTCTGLVQDIPSQTKDSTRGGCVAYDSCVSILRQSNIFGAEINQGAEYRRKAFMVGADDAVCKYEVVSCIPLSPFMHYRYPSMYRKNCGPMISHCDQLEVNVTFRANVKPWLLQGYRRDEKLGGRVLTDYAVAWAARPYLKVIFVNTPLQIPPSLTVPSNRFVNYEQVQTVPAAVDSKTWPDLIVIQAQETDAARDAQGVTWKPYFCPLVENSLKVTIGERSSLLNGMSNREIFSFYRRNAPSSEMDYETWRKYRTQILIRNDMVSHTSGGVFDPVTASFEVEFSTMIEGA